MTKRPKVAIACQGGGSHAAFAAGALSYLLGSEVRERFQLVALSGTSGGAMCAALAWRGLVSSGPDDAVRRLNAFWSALEARPGPDTFFNIWQVWLARQPVTVDLSPYLVEPLAEQRLRQLLGEHLALEGLSADARRGHPKLFIGATDVLEGDRVVFQGEGLDYGHLIASAAVPPLFRGVPLQGHYYWDGLFTTNPPIREILSIDDRPDELWVIQINPQRRTRVPQSMWDIKDRINELSGNNSLGQELFFVDRVNRLIEQHEELKGRYQRIQIRVIELEDEALDQPSKLNRLGSFIRDLLARGREHARGFFEPASIWPHEGAAPASAVVGATVVPGEPTPTRLRPTPVAHPELHPSVPVAAPALVAKPEALARPPSPAVRRGVARSGDGQRKPS